MGRGALEKKRHLVRWKTVCMEKDKGGLGIRNLSLLNKALLCKWNWRFAAENNSLWKMAINFKYGVEEGWWHTRDGRKRYEEELRKDKRKEVVLLTNHSEFAMAMGEGIASWADKWCGIEPLSVTFPSVHRGCF